MGALTLPLGLNIFTICVNKQHANLCFDVKRLEEFQFAVILHIIRGYVVGSCKETLKLHHCSNASQSSYCQVLGVVQVEQPVNFVRIHTSCDIVRNSEYAANELAKFNHYILI